jgi:NAD-dependent dihydropyrimidine dehydrogenase PreA subunit
LQSQLSKPSSKSEKREGLNSLGSLFDKGVDKLARIIVNYVKCVGDPHKICVDICPVSIFRIKKSGRPEVVNEESCIMCRTCQVNCPFQAIEILP